MSSIIFPYWDCEEDYGAGLFSKADFGRLARALGELRGRFILSLNDVEPVRSIFAGFHLEPVELSYRISGGSTEAKELLISNMDLAKAGRLV